METPAAIDGEDATTSQQASHPKSASSARAIHRRIQRAHAKNIRYALHLDTLQVYVQERLIPMGLDLKRKCQPTIGSQNTDFVRRWVEILDAASQNLMDMVIEYSAQMVAESDDEIVRLTETLQAVTLESEFEQFQETLEKYNSKLRKKIEDQKKKKLERDRLMAKEKSITVYKEHRLSISSGSSGSNSSIDQMDVFAPVMGALQQQQQHYQQQQQTEHASVPMNMHMVRHKSPTPEFIVPPAIAERTRLRPASAPEFVPPPSPQLPEKSTRHSVHFELPSPDLNARRQEYNPPQRGTNNPGMRPPPSPRNPRKQIGSGRIVEPKSPRPRRSNRPSRGAETQHRSESQDGVPVTPNTPRKHRQDSASRGSQPRANATPRQRRRDFNPKKT
ncbi:uncharacterized protein LOC144866216 [Branchiostoma floridae x Branchiostoma japonicum]